MDTTRTRTKQAITVVLVVALVVGALPALAAITSDGGEPITGTIPVTTDQTPQIYLEAGDQTSYADLENMWQGDQLAIATDEGNITVSGDPAANATLAVSDITGTQTAVTNVEAGAAWLELDPEDKARLDARGDLDAVSWSDYAADDGTTDVQLSGTQGGTAELRLYGLSASTSYGLYDPSIEQVLGNFTTDSSGMGQTTVDMPSGSQSLELITAAGSELSLSNPRPEGEVTSPPDRLTVELAADAYPATVEFRLDGEVVDTVETTQGGDISVAVDPQRLQDYNWSATVTDALGQTDTISTSFETPQNLTLREEHSPSDVIDSNNVTIRFFTADGDIVIRETTQNGTLDMTGLPNSDFVLFIESPNHYTRTAYFASIFEQQNVYLLNQTVFPRETNDAIRSRFTYEDPTGSYPRPDTTIKIQRAIDLNGDGESQFRTVAGDFWGAGGEFETILERGERYRIKIVNQETGAETLLGTHIPTEDLTHRLVTSGLVQEAKNETGVTALAELNEDQQRIEWSYHDPTNNTDELHVVIESQDGTMRIADETIPGPMGSVVGTVSLNESQLGQNWVVRFESGQHRSAHPVGTGTVGLPVPVPSWLLTLLMSMLVTFIGALYGPRTALLGAWAMVFVAAAAAMFGWAFSGVTVFVTAMVAAGATFVARTVP